MIALQQHFPVNSRLVRQRSTAAENNVATQQLITRLGSVVIVAPHPDDETLGCGGLIAACADLGITTTIVAVTNGEGSHPGSKQWDPQRLARLRSVEQQQALQALGLETPKIARLNLPDGQVALQAASVLDYARSRLLRLLQRNSPCSVFVTARDDDHPDHRACARLIMSIQRHVHGMQTFQYGVWPPAATGSTRKCKPTGDQWLLDIRPALQRKARAISCHRSQRGLLVNDDPEGFCMPARLLEQALAAHETFRKF